MNDKKRTPSSHYIHRTRYSFQEQLVGVFVLAAVVILLALLFSLLKKQNIFEDYFLLYGRLNSAAGLSKETTIQISGFEVGRVSNIEITENNDILLTLSVAKRYHKLIRTDSVVKVSSLNATIIGKSIIEITAGSPNNPQVNEGAELPVQESISIDTVIAKAQDTLKTINDMITGIADVIAAVEPEKIRGTVNSVNAMAERLNDMSGDLNAMGKHMAAGQGGLGSLIYDNQLEQTFEKGIDNLERATANLQTIMEKLDTQTDQVPVMVEDLQAVIDETRETIEATQRIWPISSAIGETEQAPKLVNPLPAND